MVSSIKHLIDPIVQKKLKWTLRQYPDWYAEDAYQDGIGHGWSNENSIYIKQDAEDKNYFLVTVGVHRETGWHQKQ